MISRRILSATQRYMTEDPVVLLQGPRAVGKSTILQELAAPTETKILDLDVPAVRDAALADPGNFVTGPAPICIDEYQKAPMLLDSIKGELNKDESPGRFVLTGSTRHDALPQIAQALTGRLQVVPIYPLTQAEIEGSKHDLVAQLFNDARATIPSADSKTSRGEYIERIVAGGFPAALARSDLSSRNRWFESYLKMTLERDALELKKIKENGTLAGVLKKLAGQTAQVMNAANIAKSLGYTEKLVASHTGLLKDLFLVHELEAWEKTLNQRTTSKSKIHVIDSGIAARLLRLTPAKLASKDPTALTEFGHLLESFLVGEIMRQVSWLSGFVPVGHWRTSDGDEVDLVIERDDGAVIAFEIKAGTQVPGSELKHLKKLRDRVGSSFLAGVALYLGERSYTYEDRIHVMPADRLWIA
jgi:uncharacterized protein